MCERNIPTIGVICRVFKKMPERDAGTDPVAPVAHIGDHLRKLRSVSARRHSGADGVPLLRSIPAAERHEY